MDIKDLAELLNKLDEKMGNSINKLDSKMDENNHKLNDVDKTLVKQHEQLVYHIKRTNLLEQAILNIEQEFKTEITSIKEDTKPVHTHVDRVEFAFKVLKWIGPPLIASLIGLVVKALIR